MADSFTTGDGIVVALEPGRIVVAMDRPAEEDCGGCRSCALKNLCLGRGRGRLELPVAVDDSTLFRPGEKVSVAYREPNAAVAALVMFLPALVGLGAGGFVGAVLGGDGGLLVGCGIGIAGGLLATFVLARKWEASRPSAVLAPAPPPAGHGDL